MNNPIETTINNFISNRRSLYPAQYSQEKIDKNIIEQILENANWAPSHKRTYPWRFKVFTGKGLEKLSKLQSSIYKEVSEKNGVFDMDKFENLRDKPLSASHVIAISMKRDPKLSIPEIEEISAVACAVQNMYLTACAYNLGVYWGTGGVTYLEETKAHFGLTENDKFMGFLYLGKLKIEKWPTGIRKPYSEFVTWEE